MEFNYFKTSVVSVMAVGALAFSASVMGASPVSVLPQEGQQETLEDFTLVFTEGDEVAWAVTGTENTPYLTLNGETCALAGPKNLAGEGNQLSINFGREFTEAGEYQLVIAEGSYTINDVPGDACQFKWDVSGIPGGITVEPAVSVLSEIQNIKITFNEAKEVSIAEDLGTEKTPYLDLVNAEGVRERRGTFFPSVVGGNNMLLTMRSPINEPGEYVVVLPGSTYFLDGEAGEDIELLYTIAESSYPDVDLSVNPATDVVETIDTIELTFGGVEIVEWAVTGTENAPYLEDLEGNRMGTFAKLSGEGNVLSMGFYTEFDVKGEYKVVIPEGSYIFQGIYNGMPGKEITLNYEVLGPGGITVEPAVNVLNEIQNIKITFNEAKEVTLAEDLGTEKTPYLVMMNEEGERERRGTFFPEVVGGNNMLLTMRSPVYEPGEYVVIIPGSTYFLDGEAGEDIELLYTVVEPSYPEVELSVNPATDVVETIDTIELTFGGVEIVEWVVTGTENAPYLVDLEGNRWGTFSVLDGQGNMLSMGFPTEFDVKGEYKVVIPEGSYVFQGIYHGMPGKEITLNYEVLGLTGYSVEPAVNVLSEIQNIKITFHEAKEVTLAEELGTENTPYLVLVNAEGERERRGTFFPEIVGGNNMLLTMRTPVYEPGEYVVIIPGSTYFLDGEAGEDIEFGYTVVEPSYPDVDLSVNPATDVVETIDTIELTFGGVEIVEWAVTGTENAPYLEDMEGNRMGTFAVLGGQGNMLSMGFYTEFDVKGEYKVVIPEGSYIFQGIYHGMPGKEITLNYEVLGLTGYSVEPAVNVLSEIQNIKITFHDAKEVTLAEDLGTENTPLLYIINAEGERERRGTFFPEIVGGNNMLLTMRSPITEPGEYVVVIPGSTYFLDGEAGEDIELIYTVIGDQSLKFTVEPAEGTLSELHTIAIAFDDCEEAVWNIEAIQTERSLCPTISSGESMKENLINLTSEGNVLYLAPYGSEAWTEAGSYIVTVPAGSYSVDGREGDEIVLAYVLSGVTAVDSLFGEKKNFDVYDINGRLIIRNADAAAVKALRGIYVIDGRKYIIR